MHAKYLTTKRIIILRVCVRDFLSMNLLISKQLVHESLQTPIPSVGQVTIISFQ